MQISVSRVSDGFRFFPYPSGQASGGTNNGGIDLVQQPGRIEEITETAALPCIKEILIQLNAANGTFMTLGFEAGQQDDFFCGYIEFAFRGTATAKREENYHLLLSSFAAWVTTEHAEVAESVCSSFVAELQEFHYHGQFHGDRMTLWFRTMNQEACDQLLRMLTEFLVEKYQHGSA